MYKAVTSVARCYAGSVREALLAAAKLHAEAFDQAKKTFIRARALMLAQRAALYSRDELEMAVLRMQLRVPGEEVKPHEAHFKLHDAEVPVKNQVRGCYDAVRWHARWAMMLLDSHAE